MRVRRVYAVAAAMILLLTLTLPVVGSETVSATLNGAPISLQRAGTLSCHDFEYPVLRCFSSPEAMQLETAGRRSQGPSEQDTAAAFIGYVLVFQHAAYAGDYMYLSADQPWLSSIGWNDRISSFKSVGATGHFRENSPTGGFTYYFSSTSQVASLSGAYNDKFSALSID